MIRKSLVESTRSCRTKVVATLSPLHQQNRLKSSPALTTKSSNEEEFALPPSSHSLPPNNIPPQQQQHKHQQRSPSIPRQLFHNRKKDDLISKTTNSSANRRIRKEASSRPILSMLAEKNNQEKGNNFEIIGVSSSMGKALLEQKAVGNKKKPRRLSEWLETQDRAKANHRMKGGVDSSNLAQLSNNINKNMRNKRVSSGTPISSIVAALKRGEGNESKINETGRGIDKLGDAFRQSLKIDRQRRLQELQQQEKNNTIRAVGDENLRNDDNESRLDKLLDEFRNNTTNRDKNTISSGGTWRQSSGDVSTSSTVASGGAKAFRERRKLAERIQRKKQQEKRRNWGKNNNPGGQWKREKYSQQGVDTNVDLKQLQKEIIKGNSLNTKGRSKNANEKETEVNLPNRSISLVELSSLLRVPKDKIDQTLAFLNGGSKVRANQRPKGKGGKKKKRVDGEIMLDIDMAELVTLELGFDAKRKVMSSKSRMMEEAERRILRQSAVSNEEGGDAFIDEKGEEEYYQSLPPRPPVVCIMGHVDHGKTTLMDSLRSKAAERARLDKTGNAMKHSNKKKKGKKKQNDALDLKNVAGTEAGGITQVISAFQVELSNNTSSSEDSKKAISSITFLDTPGHAAFKAMRQSGSNGADVIVLVVAADDGVSPQTIEIIEMYKSIARSQPGSISLVVAMTKIDKIVDMEGGDLEERQMMIENQLMENGIFTDGVGGGGEFDGVQLIPVSGMTGDGLDDLIEGLALQSEVMDLRADVEARAEGLVIDSKIESGLGVVADCIVRWGKLEQGDYVVSGVSGGKLRILNDVNNKPIKKAGPSQPVRIIGFKSLPKAGDPIICVQSEDIAEEIIERRERNIASNGGKESFRADGISEAEMDLQITGVASKHGSMTKQLLKKYGRNDDLDDGGGRAEEAEIRIPILLKADADGTLAALRDSVLNLSQESKLNLCIDPIELSIGHVTSSDVRLARDSGASILCFNLKGAKDKDAMNLAVTEGVNIRSNSVIYRLLDEAKGIFSEHFPPVQVEVVHGNAIVKTVFDINNNKDAAKIAGLIVRDGVLYLDKCSNENGVLNCEYRVKRGDKVISPPGIRANSLRKSKDDVNDVHRGDECGLGLFNYTDLNEGDVIECFSTEMKNVFM